MMHIHIHIYTYTHTYAYTHIYRYTFIHTYIHTDKHRQTNRQTDRQTYTHRYIYLYIFISIYTHTCIYRYVHTSPRICRHTFSVHFFSPLSVSLFVRIHCGTSSSYKLSASIVASRYKVMGWRRGVADVVNRFFLPQHHHLGKTCVDKPKTSFISQRKDASECINDIDISFLPIC